MKFDIDGRFQVEVRREHDGWTVYRSEQGKRCPLHDVVIPGQLAGDEIAIYLDDVFHEYAGPGQAVRRMPD